MADSLRLALAFLVACGATLLLTPLAIQLAHRTSFFDHPAGYKGHHRPTPYLGGIAVITGALLAAVILGFGTDDFLPIATGTLVLLALGTIDDGRNLSPLLRLLAEVAVAGGLFASGISWSIFPGDIPNLFLTIFFVVGVVNAFNLMDNMDGATSTVAAVSGATLGMLAAAHGDPGLGAIALALSGSCMGFLRSNLAVPARIFLGDGGSMPIGFVVATVIMAMPGGVHATWAFIPVSVVLVGLPALDTALVVVSRLRREVSVFSGGRDHLTHRLFSRIGSARGVALVLAITQALLCGLGSFLFGAGESLAAVGSIFIIVLGVGAVALLESREWAPAASEPSA